MVRTSHHIQRVLSTCQSLVMCKVLPGGDSQPIRTLCPSLIRSDVTAQWHLTPMLLHNSKQRFALHTLTVNIRNWILVPCLSLVNRSPYSPALFDDWCRLRRRCHAVFFEKQLTQGTSEHLMQQLTSPSHKITIVSIHLITLICKSPLTQAKTATVSCTALLAKIPQLFSLASQ